MLTIFGFVGFMMVEDGLVDQYYDSNSHANQLKHYTHMMKQPVQIVQELSKTVSEDSEAICMVLIL